MKILYEPEFSGLGGHPDFDEASVLGGIGSTMVDKINFTKKTIGLLIRMWVRLISVKGSL